MDVNEQLNEKLDSENGTEPKPNLEFLVQDFDGQITMKAVNEETQPKSLDEVYQAVCVLKRNIEASHTAAVIQQGMMEAAQALQGQTKSGIVIPENKNIR